MTGLSRTRARVRRRIGALVPLVLSVAAMALAQQAAEWPSEPPPRPLAAREVKFPPYEVRTLANGMQVVAVLHHEQPAASIRLLVRAGGVYNPAGKNGMAALAASLLDQGTTTRTAEQIADTIDYIGGHLSTGSGSDLTYVTSVVMKDSFVQAMDLIADITRNPAFATEEIERQRQQALSGLRVSRTDPEYVANTLFDRLVYGFHPYGLPNNGTPESLVTITRDDLQAYHKRYFVPNNMILGIVGDVTSQEAFAAAERAFGKWPRAELALPRITEPPAPTRRVVVVDMPDAVQTEVRVGHLGIARKHKDYLPLNLAFRILGGEGANRLHRVLRSERGLTYGASADIAALKQTGDFQAETDTRTESTAEVLKLVIGEYATLLRERVGERELADAQAYLAGAFPLTIETPDAIATQVLNNVFYELPPDEIGTFAQRVQSVTPEDVQRVAREYVSPDRLAIVLVGNAAAFVPQLKKAGFSDVEVVPVWQIDLMSPTLKADAPSAPAPPSPGAGPGPRAGDTKVRLDRLAYTRTPTSVVRAGDAQSDTELLSRAVTAKGGLTTLKNVRSVVAAARTTVKTQQGPVESETTTYIVYPDRFRVDAQVAGATIAQTFNAGQAWVRDPSGVHEAPPPMRADFAASVQRDTIPLLIAAAEGRLSVRRLPDEGDAGRVLRVFELSGQGVTSPVKVSLDQTDMIVRLAYTTPGPTARPIQVEERFSEYRSVEGVQVPFHAELRHNGKPVLERNLTDVKVNQPVDVAMFERPAR